MSEQKPSLTYRDAGVDIDAGNELVNRIKDTAARTRRLQPLLKLADLRTDFLHSALQARHLRVALPD